MCNEEQCKCHPQKHTILTQIPNPMSLLPEICPEGFNRCWVVGPSLPLHTPCMCVWTHLMRCSMIGQGESGKSQRYNVETRALNSGGTWRGPLASLSQAYGHSSPSPDLPRIQNNVPTRIGKTGPGNQSSVHSTEIHALSLMGVVGQNR